MLGWLRKNRNGGKPKAEEAEEEQRDGSTEDTEEEMDAVAPEVEEDEVSGEYEKGEFKISDKKRAKQLRQHDSQARTVYNGIEGQIDKLRKLTDKIKGRKLKCSEPEPEGGNGTK
jgi:hypothetical protein